MRLCAICSPNCRSDDDQRRKKSISGNVLRNTFAANQSNFLFQSLFHIHCFSILYYFCIYYLDFSFQHYFNILPFLLLIYCFFTTIFVLFITFSRCFYLLTQCLHCQRAIFLCLLLLNLHKTFLTVNDTNVQ